MNEIEENKIVDEESKINEVRAMLTRNYELVNTLNVPRINFSSILEDEKLLAVYHKEWKIIFKPYQYITKLRRQFVRDYEINPELAIGNLRRYLSILTNLTEIFSPKEILRLRSITALLDKSEIDEIHKCMADVGRWADYALKSKGQTDRINFFFNRLVVYLRGGVLDGTQFLGLYSHFRDAELARQLLQNSAVRRLRVYKKQIEFFRMASEVITQALKNPGWQGFLGPNGFYYNLRKGKKYIKMVREEFQNEEFASYLERLNEKIHESPEAWGGSMHTLSEKLNNSDYQNTQVIHPAMQELLALFQKAIDSISKSGVDIKLVDSTLGKLENEIRKRLKKLKGEIEEIGKEFDAIDGPAADELNVVLPVLMDYMYRVGHLSEARGAQVAKVIVPLAKWAEFFNAYKTIPGIGLFGAIQLDKIEGIKYRLINAPLIDNFFESSVIRLEGRIKSALIPKLQKVREFIQQHDSKFALPISTTANLLPELQDFINKNPEKSEFAKPNYG